MSFHTKIFTGGEADKVEEEMNTWFEEHFIWDFNYTILKLSQSQVYAGHSWIIVLYKKEEKTV